MGAVEKWETGVRVAELPSPALARALGKVEELLRAQAHAWALRVLYGRLGDDKRAMEMHREAKRLMWETVKPLRRYTSMAVAQRVVELHQRVQRETGQRVHLRMPTWLQCRASGYDGPRIA